MNKGVLACFAVLALAMSEICMACGDSPVVSTRKSDGTAKLSSLPTVITSRISCVRPSAAA